MTKDEFARIVAETCTTVADGYTRNADPKRLGESEQASIAAGNAGYFILSRLDYTHAEIVAMFARARGNPGALEERASESPTGEGAPPRRV